MVLLVGAMKLLAGQNRDTDIEHRFVDTAGEGGEWDKRKVAWKHTH